MEILVGAIVVGLLLAAGGLFYAKNKTKVDAEFKVVETTVDSDVKKVDAVIAAEVPKIEAEVKKVEEAVVAEAEVVIKKVRAPRKPKLDVAK